MFLYVSGWVTVRGSLECHLRRIQWRLAKYVCWLVCLRLLMCHIVGTNQLCTFSFVKNILFISFFKFKIVNFVFILFCAQLMVTDWSVTSIICWSNLQFFGDSKFSKSKQKVVYYLLTKMCHLTWIYYFYWRSFFHTNTLKHFYKTGTASNKLFYQSEYCNANKKKKHNLSAWWWFTGE